MDVKKIIDIEKDIKDLNIQGATNVAIATLEGMKTFIQETEIKDIELFYKEAIEVGHRLANARENEPLARNGVKFVRYEFERRSHDLQSIEDMKQVLEDYCDNYLFLISDSKRAIVETGVINLKFMENVLTHCHSSTGVALIKGIAQNKPSFDVVCTETRPLLQGRISAKSFVEEGISTTLIADSAAESFVIGRGSIPIDGVFIGCDQITMKGHCINKIGSWGIAFASYYAEKPLYVVSPLLKVSPDIGLENLEIEVRESREIWDDAPKDLKIYNPAFEIVDNSLITGFVTEFGILKPKDIGNIVRTKYPWLFES